MTQPSNIFGGNFQDIFEFQKHQLIQSIL